MNSPHKSLLPSLVALFTVLTLLVSVLGTAAFAQEPATSCRVYTAIGDSIGAGYGLVRDDSGKSVLVNGQMEPGSYPQLVVSGVGAEKVHFRCYGGSSVVCALRCLDPEYEAALSDAKRTGTEYLMYDLAHMPPADFAEMQQNMADEVREADLITINLGSNDLNYLGDWVVEQEFKNSTTGELAQALNEQLVALGVTDVTTTKLYSLGKTVLVKALGLTRGYREFQKDWDRLVKDIRTLNPDATIVAVGLYNPFRDLKITRDSDVAIGKLADGIICGMNRYIESGSKMSSTYRYADVSDVSVFGFSPLKDGKFIDEIMLAIHPDAKGQALIAERILSALQ